MVSKKKKEAFFGLGIFGFIGLVVILSNNYIKLLESITGLEAGWIVLIIFFLMSILAYYHDDIAKKLVEVI
jgi:hypothetical protein